LILLYRKVCTEDMDEKLVLLIMQFEEHKFSVTVNTNTFIFIRIIKYDNTGSYFCFLRPLKLNSVAGDRPSDRRNLWAVQPVARRYTDGAIPAIVAIIIIIIIIYYYYYYIRNFRLFNSCSTCKNSPSARLASAANDISRAVDVFETRHVLRNYLS
jgi:hypothetical protein